MTLTEPAATWSICGNAVTVFSADQPAPPGVGRGKQDQGADVGAQLQNHGSRARRPGD